MQVKPLQAASIITNFLKARLVPIMSGSPGIGKSQIYQQIADQFNLKLIDIRLSTCDVTDLTGFPKIEGNKASYTPMSVFPLEGDAVPKGYSGWLLLFDEISSAVPALQAAAYKILLDRKVGEYSLHKNVAMCAAGNLETDNAVVQPMSTALQSRLVHLELIVDAKEWTDWASTAGIDHRITSYINFKPTALYTFQPDHTDKTYACPRTWEFAHRILQVTDLQSKEALPMLAGTISEGVAREFIGFCKVFNDLPKIEDIMKNPEGINMPSEPSVLYALTGALSANATTDNFESLMKFILRMPLEFQVVCLREAVKRNKKIMGHSAVQKWIAHNAHEFF